jgi:hypothetical protein
MLSPEGDRVSSFLARFTSRAIPFQPSSRDHHHDYISGGTTSGLALTALMQSCEH